MSPKRRKRDESADMDDSVKDYHTGASPSPSRMNEEGTSPFSRYGAPKMTGASVDEADEEYNENRSQKNGPPGLPGLVNMSN